MKLAFDKYKKLLYFITILMELLSMGLIEELEFLDYTSYVVALLLRLYWYLLIFDIRTIRETVFGRLILISFSGLIVGMLFRIQHWEKAGLILSTSIFLIALFYILKKLRDQKERGLIRTFKMLYVIFMGIGAIIKFQHYNWIEEISIINVILFFALITTYTFFEKSPPQKPFLQANN